MTFSSERATQGESHRTHAPPLCHSLSAIILAGGYSRRMGKDKALLELSSGRSLLENTLHTAQQLTSRCCVITPWPQRYQSALPNELQQSVEWVQESGHITDIAPGPLSGFVQGLAHLSQMSAQPIASHQQAWVLLLACDLPNLDGEPLQRWWRWIQERLRELQQTDSEETGSEQIAIQASLVRSQKGWEPLCGFYTLSCLGPITSYQQQGGRSFQAWLDGQTMSQSQDSASAPHIIPYDDLPRAILFNCNRPEDWQKVYEQSDK